MCEARCPVCFEQFTTPLSPDAQFLEARPRKRHVQLNWTQCCHQYLCRGCEARLYRCPMCRCSWAGDHAWLGGIVPEFIANSQLLAVGSALLDMALIQDAQVRRLQQAVRQRDLRFRCRHKGIGKLLREALAWNFLQRDYDCGGCLLGARDAWRSRLRAAISGPAAGMVEDPADLIGERSEQALLWADLTFLFLLWFDFAPGAYGWGYCESFGTPPFYLCLRSHWIESLQHVAVALARLWHPAGRLCNDKVGLSARQPCIAPPSARRLLAMLDLALSRQGTGQSSPPTDDILEVVVAAGNDQPRQPSHSWALPAEAPAQHLPEAHAAARRGGLNGVPRGGLALPEEEQAAGQAVHLLETHFLAMARRSLPDTYCGLWGQGRGLPVGRA